MAGAASRPARLLSRRALGGGLHLVALDVEAWHQTSFVTPGQYAELTIAGKNGYFALSSVMQAAPWELVVKDSGGASRALLTAQIGAGLLLTSALGAGFPVERAAGAPAVLAVTGSAVSVLRPLLAHREAEGDLAHTYVFVGARALSEAPLAEELVTWARKGAHVWLATSRSHEGSLPPVRIVRGYVQNAIEEALAAGLLPRGAAAFAAGHGEMVKTLVAGGSLSSVYTNV
jgi:NAD(P)H-flavin reductase